MQARFNEDATFLATLGKRITLWDVVARRRVATGPPMANAASVDFSPDGQLLAAKNTSGDVIVMGVPDLEERARLAGRGFGEGTDIRFAPDSRHLVDGSWSGLLTVRDGETGAVTWQEPGSSIFRLASTLDRRTWAYDRWAREDGRLLVRSWPFDEQSPEPVPGLEGAMALAFSRDRRRLAVVERELFVFERVPADGPWRVAARRDSPPGEGPAALSWSPDGALLAYSGAGRAIVFDNELRPQHEQALRYASDAHFASTGTLIAFGDWSSGIVTAWPPHGSEDADAP